MLERHYALIAALSRKHGGDDIAALVDSGMDDSVSITQLATMPAVQRAFGSDL
jgi:hypothetical protein